MATEDRSLKRNLEEFKLRIFSRKIEIFTGDKFHLSGPTLYGRLNIKLKVKVKSLSRVQLFATPWTV